MVGVAVFVAVRDGVAVGVRLAVAVAVTLGVGVAESVAVGVSVGVGVIVTVGVGVAVGDGNSGLAFSSRKATLSQGGTLHVVGPAEVVALLVRSW